MALAERGNEAEVSNTAGEYKEEIKEANYFDNFPPNAVVHSFGNTLKPDFKGSSRNIGRAIFFLAKSIETAYFRYIHTYIHT